VGGISDISRMALTGLLGEPRGFSDLCPGHELPVDYPEENQRIGQNAKSARTRGVGTPQTIRISRVIYVCCRQDRPKLMKVSIVTSF